MELIMAKWIQVYKDGEWILIEEAPRISRAMMLLPDIKPYVAYATKEPTLISSRSAERKYMKDNDLVHNSGFDQDIARNKAVDEANNKQQIKQTLIDIINR
jgi:hypothetical protein